MKTLTLREALDCALATRTKHAEISTSPRTFFVHVRVPEHVAEDLRAVQKRVIPDASKHEDIDHITLVYTKKPLDDHPPDKVHAALSALREIGEKTEPIKARIQGWGYFDGASKSGQPSTALVALVDAPGLEHLHVDMSRKLKDMGVEPSDLHVFTPHITLGYLGHQGRADELPPISGHFTIDKTHVASRDHHEVPLNGGMSLKAAMDEWKDKIPGGLSDDKKPSDFPKDLLAQGRKVELEHTSDPAVATEIAMDHLSEDRAYYDKLKKCVEKESALGERAAQYALRGSD